MKIVAVLSGIPGSGKSRLAQDILRAYAFTTPEAKSACIVSSDYYFMCEGVYEFDSARLPDAHAWCMSRFLTYTENACDLVIVDNTNTEAYEIAPYMLVGQTRGYSTILVNVDASLESCLARQTHRVPAEIVTRMHKTRQTRTLPAFWWQVSALDVISKKHDLSKLFYLTRQPEGV